MPTATLLLTGVARALPARSLTVGADTKDSVKVPVEGQFTPVNCTVKVFWSVVLMFTVLYVMPEVMLTDRSVKSKQLALVPPYWTASLNVMVKEMVLRPVGLLGVALAMESMVGATPMPGKV